MFIPTRRRLPLTTWLIPALLLLVMAAAATVDYFKQHARFSLFGQPVDVSDVRSVVVQAPPSSTFHTVSGNGQIVTLLRALSQADPDTDSAPQNTVPVASLYLDFADKGVVPVRLYSSPDHPEVVYAEVQNRVYTMPATVMTVIQTMAK